MSHRPCQTQHTTSVSRASAEQLQAKKKTFVLLKNRKVHKHICVHIHTVQPLGFFPQQALLCNTGWKCLQENPEGLEAKQHPDSALGTLLENFKKEESS